MRYREVPKNEVISTLGGHGWHFRGEELGDRAWTLRFVLAPAHAGEAVREGASRHRIAAELGGAEPDERGRYRLDLSQYADLDPAEVRAAADVAGWSITGSDPASAGNVLLLSRSGGRARVVGSDRLDWARGRHEHWTKQFNRQVVLAFAYGIVGLLVLFATLGSFDPGDGSRFYVMLAIAIVLLCLLAVAVLKAMGVRRKRHAEIGGLLDPSGRAKADG
ncbi:hypothetical protein GCM10023222_05880 [Saccharopolyspora cebuensis]